MTPEPWETWLARYVPAVMYSDGTGNTFTEVVSDTFEQTFSIIAISGWGREPGAYAMDALIKKTGIGKSYHMGMRLQGIPKATYHMDVLLKKSINKTYPIDALIRKTCSRPYLTDVLLQDTFSKDYTMKTSIALRKMSPYTMDFIAKRVGGAPYRMDFLSRKTVSKSYGMDLIIVGNYIAPLKREISLLFPQPFDLSAEVRGYTLRDVIPQEIEKHGY